MAQFINQAQLNYNGITRNSNIAVGEITEALTIAKKALNGTYRAGDKVTYIISLVNSSASPLSGITLSDDLGAYTLGVTSVTPLTYVNGTAALYINGVLQAAPTVNPGPPLVFSGITIPANSNAVLVYEAEVNIYAPLDTNGEIVNTVTVSGGGVISATTATETITAASGPDLNITKSISPIPVSDNGTLTYTFTIQNYGNTAATAADSVVFSDTFNPVLSNITAALNGTALTANTDYTYNASTGLFETVAGKITVPAATFSQNPTTGEVTVTPGISTIIISGTV